MSTVSGGDTTRERVAKALREAMNENGAVYGDSWEYVADNPDSLAEIVDAVMSALVPPKPVLEATGNERFDADGDQVMGSGHLKILHQGTYVCDTCVNVLGFNIRWDHAEKRHFGT